MDLELDNRTQLPPEKPPNLSRWGSSASKFFRFLYNVVAAATDAIPSAVLWPVEPVDDKELSQRKATPALHIDVDLFIIIRQKSR